MAGYAYWLIPMLSFAIVNGGKGLGNAMIGIIGSGQSVGNAAGSETAKGNVNMGNVSYNNTSANKQSADAIYTDPAMVGTKSSVGSYSWNNGEEGSVRASATRHDLPVSSQASIKASEIYSQKAAQSIQAAQSQEAMASSATTIGNAYTMAYAVSQGSNTASGREIASRLSADEQRSINEVAKASEALTEKWGTQHSSVASSALSLGLGLNKGVGKSETGSASINRSKEGKQGSIRQAISALISEQFQKSTSATGSINSQGVLRNQDQMTRDVMDQLSALQEKGVSYTDSMGKSISESNSFREAVQSGNTLASNAQASYSAAQSATMSAKQSYSEAQAFELSAQKAASSDASITVDTSASTAGAYFGQGGQLGQIYNNPTHQNTIISAGQSALEGREALQTATSGSDFNPDRTLESSDTPQNNVGAAHRANVADLNKNVGGSFSNIEQKAASGGISASQTQTDIAGKQQGLESDLSERATGFNQHQTQVTGNVTQDHQNLKGNYQDALEATSPMHMLNSAQVLPGARSDGSNGMGVDMVKDISSKVVNQSELHIPGSGGHTEGYTQNQQDIQQENKEASKLSNFFGFGDKGSGSVTITNFKVPKKDEGEDSPKP